MLSATTFQGYKKCCMLAMDVWCFSKSTARIDLEKHQTRLHYWGISLCNFGESPLQFWVFLLYTKQAGIPAEGYNIPGKTDPAGENPGKEPDCRRKHRIETGSTRRFSRKEARGGSARNRWNKRVIKKQQDAAMPSKGKQCPAVF